MLENNRGNYFWERHLTLIFHMWATNRPHIMGYQYSAGNAVAFYHFIVTPTKSGNSRFFKHIYTVLSAGDLLLCASLFPVIESVFTQGKLAILCPPNLSGYYPMGTIL